MRQSLRHRNVHQCRDPTTCRCFHAPSGSVRERVLNGMRIAQAERCRIEGNEDRGAMTMSRVIPRQR